MKKTSKLYWSEMASLTCFTLALTLLAACGGLGSIAPSGAAAAANPASISTNNSSPHANNVVVVIMENRDYSLVIGSPDAPYINGTLVPAAALMTNSHAITHPSEPNYLALFSGSTQGIDDDSCPHSFSAANAGAELIGAFKTLIENPVMMMV